MGHRMPQIGNKLVLELIGGSKWVKNIKRSAGGLR